MQSPLFAVQRAAEMLAITPPPRTPLKGTLQLDPRCGCKTPGRSACPEQAPLKMHEMPHAAPARRRVQKEARRRPGQQLQLPSNSLSVSLSQAQRQLCCRHHLPEEPAREQTMLGEKQYFSIWLRGLEDGGEKREAVSLDYCRRYPASFLPGSNAGRSDHPGG